MVDGKEPPQGAFLVLLAVAAGVAMIGFAQGTSLSDYEAFHLPERRAEHAVQSDVPTALSYRGMRTTSRGHTSDLPADLERLHAALPSRLAEVELSAVSKVQDLAARAERRAYDGAPPVIPHPVRQGAAPECLACHEHGLRVGDRTASMMPHEPYQSCTQCHAMSEPNVPWEQEGMDSDPRAVPNSFVGQLAVERGARWTSISPPVMPHKGFMRSRCESCHGVTGRQALRSSHPQRHNCEQCHTKSVGVEWRPGGLQ